MTQRVRAAARRMLPAGDWQAPATLDLWGREQARPNTYDTTYLYRLLSPIEHRHVEKDFATELDYLLIRYNELHPNEPARISGPRWWFTHRGETVRMTEDEFRMYSAIKGQKALSILERVRGRLRFDHPTEKDIDVIRKALSKGHKYAKEKVFGIK